MLLLLVDAPTLDRNGDMADLPQFFVVVFSRTKAKGIRIEAAIKAVGERHAKLLVSHFSEEEQGAVALARRGSNINVVAQFGGVAANDAWAVIRALGPLGRANPFTRTHSATRIEHSRRRRLL
jgi:hypothetical protein